MNRPESESTSGCGSVRVAAVQMVSTPRLADNLRDAAELIGRAVAQGLFHFAINGAALGARQRRCALKGGNVVTFKASLRVHRSGPPAGMRGLN